jgi:hypothetical protein
LAVNIWPVAEPPALTFKIPLLAAEGIVGLFKRSL